MLKHVGEVSQYVAITTLRVRDFVTAARVSGSHITVEATLSVLVILSSSAFAQPSSVSIVSKPLPPPAPAVIAPPPPPVPAVKPTNANRHIHLKCPTQVQPEYPEKAERGRTEGVVQAQATIKDGKVIEVSFLSGPRVFYPAVRAAMLQYKCVSVPGETIATQKFAFKKPRVACPTQIAPVMPKEALQLGIQGDVSAEMKIKGGRVTDVTILSSPSIFDDAVRTAAMQYKCVSDPGETTVTQSFNFTIK